MSEPGGGNRSKPALWVLLVGAAAVVVASAVLLIGDPSRVPTWFTLAGGLVSAYLAVTYLRQASDRR
ncbi:hypothetical protein [Frigoribacterium sp. CFBP 8751]|uniref:hypothetical protein n=1 Tax=Frigoribacterium sp. CFBP 8751 TaxID=2775277 RepID=UPI0017845D98|nr:hypothetical protein [Frigoribacterium sp. CFBP 8751]MBD8539194.1 hypothetical protein [Frigoribacterium sp. CFBP 8751]